MHWTGNTATRKSLVSSVKVSKLFLTTVLVACLAPHIANAVEKRGFVVNWFHTANYATPDNCPNGQNAGTFEYRERQLVAKGYTEEEARKMLIESSREELKDLLSDHIQHAGKEVHVYNMPMSIPDTHIETVAGKFAYGFDLNGRVDSEDFEDPETLHRGIDNQLWRAVGCFKDYDFSLPTRPFYEQAMWDAMIGSMPAWVIMIAGEDLSRDGPVTVTLNKALTHFERNASGGALVNATYVIDPNPRSYNVFQGKLKEGLITVEPSDLRLEGESPFLTEVNLDDAQLRLKLENNGDLTGFVGGYQRWMEFYFMYASYGGDCTVPDRPGLYHALKRLADADPDPATGQNESISATYRIEAVPAFLANLEGQIVARPATMEH